MTHPEAARWAKEDARQREWGQRTNALDEKGYQPELCRAVYQIGLTLPKAGEHLLRVLLTASEEDVAAVNVQRALTEAHTRLQDLVEARDAVEPGVVEETASPADELEQLRAWKAEAMEVLARWELVWDAAGRPGRLGRSKTDNVREWIEAQKPDGQEERDG